MKLHVLKIKLEHFKEVVFGYKKAEVRRNDRDFQKGDLIHFVQPDGTEYPSFENNAFAVTHVLTGVPEYGLADGYAVVSIERLSDMPRGFYYARE